jgi:hypothetical protein
MSQLIDFFFDSHTRDQVVDARGDLQHASTNAGSATNKDSTAHCLPAAAQGNWKCGGDYQGELGLWPCIE